jgi:hypothetical protein
MDCTYSKFRLYSENENTRQQHWQGRTNNRHTLDGCALEIQDTQLMVSALHLPKLPGDDIEMYLRQS